MRICLALVLVLGVVSGCDGRIDGAWPHPECPVAEDYPITIGFHGNLVSMESKEPIIAVVVNELAGGYMAAMSFLGPDDLNQLNPVSYRRARFAGPENLYLHTGWELEDVFRHEQEREEFTLDGRLKRSDEPILLNRDCDLLLEAHQTEKELRVEARWIPHESLLE